MISRCHGHALAAIWDHNALKNTAAPEQVEARLVALRAEIDRLDQDIVERLIARMAVVEAVRRVKTEAGDGDGAPFFRPGREAQLLRRLVASSAGRLNPTLLVPMWRALLSHTTRLQGPLRVALGGQDPGLARLARDHFGPFTAVTATATPAFALGALRTGAATLALLPTPGSTARWWLDHLHARGEWHVVAGLPFLEMAGAAEAVPAPEAVLLAAAPAEPSGDDVLLTGLRADAGDAPEDAVLWDRAGHWRLIAQPVRGGSPAGEARRGAVQLGLFARPITVTGLP